MPDDHIPEGSVVITPREVYEEMRSIRDEVKHLSSIVDPALAEVRADVADNRLRVEKVDSDGKMAMEKLEGRVRAVEHRVLIGSGIAIALGTGGGWLVSALTGG